MGSWLMRFKWIIALLGLIVAGLPKAESAEILLDSVTGRTIDTSGDIANISTLNTWQGYSFEVGATGYGITGIEFVPATTNSVDTKSDITIALYPIFGTNVVPASNETPLYLQTMTNLNFRPANSVSVSDLVAFSPSSTWAINSSSRYALIFQQSSIANVGISIINSTTPPSTGTSGVTYLNQSATTNGINWINATGSVNPYFLKLTGTTSVPEPSTYLLGFISVCLMISITNRKIKSTI
jgi:hypothetical protein